MFLALSLMGQQLMSTLRAWWALGLALKLFLSFLTMVPLIVSLQWLSLAVLAFSWRKCWVCALMFLASILSVLLAAMVPECSTGYAVVFLWFVLWNALAELGLRAVVASAFVPSAPPARRRRIFKVLRILDMAIKVGWSAVPLPRRIDPSLTRHTHTAPPPPLWSAALRCSCNCCRTSREGAATLAVGARRALQQSCVRLLFTMPRPFD